MIDVHKKLNSVGKQAFVENFDLFKRFADGSCSRESAIAELVRRGVGNREGSARRVGEAKLIFEHGREGEALELVVRAGKVPDAVRRRAALLIQDHRPTPSPVARA